jgi:hypothetical protein
VVCIVEEQFGSAAFRRRCKVPLRTHSTVSKNSDRILVIAFAIEGDDDRPKGLGLSRQNNAPLVY